MDSDGLGIKAKPQIYLKSGEQGGERSPISMIHTRQQYYAYPRNPKKNTLHLRHQHDLHIRYPSDGYIQRTSAKERALRGP